MDTGQDGFLFSRRREKKRRCWTRLPLGKTDESAWLFAAFGRKVAAIDPRLRPTNRSGFLTPEVCLVLDTDLRRRGCLFFWKSGHRADVAQYVTPTVACFRNGTTYKTATLSRASFGADLLWDHTWIDDFDQRCPIRLSRGRLLRRLLGGAAV
jgi:hypothetical protein